MPTKTALFIGRFQPFHNGHLDALQQIAEKHDVIKIGIGSSQEEGTEKNPYSYELRKQMIESVLSDIKAKINIFPIPDINNDDLWVDHVKGIVNKFDIVYSGNLYVIKLFKKANINTAIQKFNLNINATQIRKIINKGGNTNNYLSNYINELINKNEI